MTELADHKIIARVNDYDGLVAVLRQRQANPLMALGSLRSHLGPMLQSLGLALAVVEDLEALSRVKNRFGTPERRVMPAKDAHEVITLRFSRRKLQQMGRKGGRQTAQSLSPKQRQTNARRAAMARWRKARSGVRFCGRYWG